MYSVRLEIHINFGVINRFGYHTSSLVIIFHEKKERKNSQKTNLNRHKWVLKLNMHSGSTRRLVYISTQ